jgi:hypothetical protein
MFRKNAMIAGLMIGSGLLGGVVATSIHGVDAQQAAPTAVTATSVTIKDASGVTRALLDPTGLTVYDATGLRRAFYSQQSVNYWYSDGAFALGFGVNTDNPTRGTRP